MNDQHRRYVFYGYGSSGDDSCDEESYEYDSCDDESSEYDSCADESSEYDSCAEDD